MDILQGGAAAPHLGDPQQAEAVDRCANGCEIWGGEAVYLWDGRRLCPDCFEGAVSSWLKKAPKELADALGVEAVTAGEKG